MSAPHRPEPTDRDAVITAFSGVIDTISRSMVQIFARQLAPEGITVLQYHALKAIHRSGTELGRGPIARDRHPARTRTADRQWVCQGGEGKWGD